jgi:hypothetical protein
MLPVWQSPNYQPAFDGFLMRLWWQKWRCGWVPFSNHWFHTYLFKHWTGLWWHGFSSPGEGNSTGPSMAPLPRFLKHTLLDRRTIQIAWTQWQTWVVATVSVSLGDMALSKLPNPSVCRIVKWVDGFCSTCPLSCSCSAWPSFVNSAVLASRVQSCLQGLLFSLVWDVACSMAETSRGRLPKSLQLVTSFGQGNS